MCLSSRRAQKQYQTVLTFVQGIRYTYLVGNRSHAAPLQLTAKDVLTNAAERMLLTIDGRAVDNALVSPG